MIDFIINNILEFLLNIFKEPRIVVVLISILPIVEARGAIPIAISYGLNPLEGWLYAFIGSSLITPILLLVLLPFIKWLSKTKLFAKAGNYIYNKFESKSKGIKGANGIISNELSAAEKQKIDRKKMLGVFIFVAIPLPLTGVWTGSAVASILQLKFPKALISIICGNLVASGIITLLCVFFEKYINWIILALAIVAIVTVILLIIKIIISKPKVKENK